MLIEKTHSFLKIGKKNEFKYEGIKITLIYLICGFLWIRFSDTIAYKIADSNETLLLLNMYKGWFYVVITAAMLYLLINNLLKKVALAENKLNESYEELASVNEELEAYVQQLSASEEELRAQYDQIIENEMKLRKSEEKNTAIIKAIPDLLFVIDSDGCFIDCMVGYESLLLMPKEAFIGKKICEVMPREISEIANEKLKSVITHGMLESFEYKLKVHGKEHYFELRMVKSNDKEVLAISRNVTAERQSGIELKASEERYKALITKMQQGLGLYEGKPDDNVLNYRLLDANEIHEKLLGINTKNNLGRTVGQIIPDLSTETIETLNFVVKTGKSVKFEHSFRAGKYYEVIAYSPQKFQIAVIIYDITQRKQAEEALKASEYTFRKLFEGSSDAILIAEDNKVVDCNLAMLELLGYDSKAHIIGECPEMFSPEIQPDGESSLEKASRMYERTLKNGKCIFEWWYKRVDSSILPAEVMMTSIFLNGKEVIHYLWRDINDRKQLENKLEFLSYHDQLTGLYNRRFFEEELPRLDIEANLPLTLVMADVNGLKLVNDSFGHAIGDKLLKKVVEIMVKGCRKRDIIARLAGDEFIILLPKTDTYETEQIVQNIKDLASRETVGSVEISISFGYETKRSTEEKISDILKKAEDYMYKKKLFESPSMRGKTISTIITTLHEKNKREEQHSHRVSMLCESMGRAIGLSEDEIKELKTVGLLHDIGKIAIDENILNKPGKLTEDEWEAIKRHPEIGYRILSTVNDLSEMAEYVLAHHEKWNGTGYPKNLKGDEIPLKSRIIAIVDTYDAMVSDRSYRDALPEEVALQELKNNAGIQFDPELVSIFIEKVL